MGNIAMTIIGKYSLWQCNFLNYTNNIHCRKYKTTYSYKLLFNIKQNLYSKKDMRVKFGLF